MPNQYKTLEGERYERNLVEYAEHHEGRSLTIDDARELWKLAMDGNKLTGIEEKTLRYIIKNFKMVTAGKSLLSDSIRQYHAEHQHIDENVDRSVKVKIIDGVEYNHEILKDVAEVASKNGGVLKMSDIKALVERYAKVHAGGYVSDIHFRTLRFECTNFRDRGELEKNIDGKLVEMGLLSSKTPAPIEPERDALVLGRYKAKRVEKKEIYCDFRVGIDAVKGNFSYTRVQLWKNGKVLTYDEVVKSMTGSDTTLRTLFARVLAGEGKLVPYLEYFWECVPVSKETLATTTYEFVAIDAPKMTDKEADVKAFSDRFVSHMGTSECLQFMTLSPPPKETSLVVPSKAPGTKPRVYRSIGSFFRGAPDQQQHIMLKKLFSHIVERMRTRGGSKLPLWVSTAGYDIAWLHMRVDDFPKYFKFKEYANKRLPFAAMVDTEAPDAKRQRT